MRQLFMSTVLMVMSIGAWSQVPQFSSTNYADWIYANPAIELNTTNILANRIVLYTTTTGLMHTLTSPAFDCYAGQTIDMHVIWVTDMWKNESFVASKAALTVALLNDQGVTVDSVTWTPTSVSRYNYVDLSLNVSRTLKPARLKFVSWKADVISSGAVRQIDAVSILRGDVNSDGEITVADANAVIDAILKDDANPELMSLADVNRDGEVTVADVNRVVDLILK